MKHLLSLFFSCCVISLAALNPSATEILKEIDRNMISGTSISTTRMVVHSRRSSRSISSRNYSSGNDKFYSEYISPPREKGTKMLKLGDDLWIFDPKSDRSVKVSGNMLKQSVMGSDLSYEDFMEEGSLLADYSANIIKESSYDQRQCWVLELTASRPDVSYHKCLLYVDKERYVTLYQELYAKNGKLLKTIHASDLQKSGKRWYPRKFVFKDNLKSGKGTEYYIDQIEFDVPIAKHVFSKAMLK